MMIIAYALLVAGLVGFKALQIKELMAQPFVEPSAGVTTIETRADVWQETLEAVASLAPVQGVMLRAELAGQVIALGVENGTHVEEGQILMRLDTSVEESQLRAVQAQLAYAELQLERARTLVQSAATSENQVDLAQADVDRYEAQIDEVKATIAKKIIRAPFAGRVGIRAVNLGQYVSPGDELIPLHRLDTIFADFSLPQRYLAELKQGSAVTLRVDAFPDQTFTGEVTATNPQIDPVTRNLALQATFANPGELLRPGMFGRISVDLPRKNDVVAVPATAIAYAPYGNSVFIVTEEPAQGDKPARTVVKQNFIHVGSKRGDLVAITGIEPGVTIVSAGVFKLRNGAPIQVNNAVQISTEAAPTPANT